MNIIVDILETHCDDFRSCENYHARVSITQLLLYRSRCCWHYLVCLSFSLDTFKTDIQREQKIGKNANKKLKFLNFGNKNSGLELFLVFHDLDFSRFGSKTDTKLRYLLQDIFGRKVCKS